MKDLPGSTSPRSRECSDVLASLPLYVGRDLDSAEMDEVALHLDGCVACAAQHDRAQSARAALAAGAWVTPDSEGPSLWEGVRAGMVAEGMLGGRPRLVSGRLESTAAEFRTGVLVRVSRGRWWIGSGAAAAAVFFAFGLSGLLGPVGSSGGGFAGSAVDVDGTRPIVRFEPRPTVRFEPRAPGHLQRVGAEKAPLLRDAVEWLPEQGIFVPVTPPAKPSLVEGPRRLKPIRR